jgi:hypothetical protein
MYQYHRVSVESYDVDDDDIDDDVVVDALG